MNTYDDDTHVYRIDGREVPGVTRVIRDVLPGFQADPWHLERGVQLHKAIELYNLGNLDFDTVDPAIRGRLDAWIKFCTQYPARMVAVEPTLFHTTFMFGGRIDCVMSAVASEHIIIDAKSSYSKRAVVQLGGYALLWRSFWKHTALKGIVVKLNDNGTYHPEFVSVYEMQRAETAFASCLGAFNVRRMCGIKEAADVPEFDAVSGAEDCAFQGGQEDCHDHP